MRGKFPFAIFGGKKEGQSTLFLTFIVAFIAVSGLAVAMERGAFTDGGSFFDNSADAGRQLPDNDHARGLVFDGLLPGGSECPGGFKVDIPGNTICTHGPDAGPPGLDVRFPPGLDGLSNPNGVPAPAAADGHDHVHADGSIHKHEAPGDLGGEATSASSTGGVPLIGDGVSGNRVQAVYAVASDQPDRFNEIAPLIAGWAAHMDAMMNQSAALTGGERHIRFVTDPSGALNIQKVILPADGDDSFSKTINAMKAAGYDQSSRKYLIWMDAAIYCGIASIYNDDRPGQENYNNGRFAQYSRVDSGCWGHSNSVELHEIVHNIGGVQQSAPNSTPGYHCTDEYDRMCYRDSSSVQMTYVCANSMEAYLDCGNDDYFHTSPPPNSYLADHWNVADSSFLEAGSNPPPPPPDNTAPEVSVSGPASVEMPSAAFLDGTVTDDGLPGPYSVGWSKASGPGTVTFSSPNAEDTNATFSAPGSYVLELLANDGELTGSASLTIEVQEAPPPPANTAPTVAATGPASLTMPASANLDGTVTDDGLPGPYSVLWSVESGPGAVTFGDASAEDTTATFSAPGDYVLTLTANDGELTGSDSVAITVEEEPPANTAPVVTASGPASVTMPDDASLSGSVTDDGLPGPYSVAWTKSSGPGTVTFANPNAENTTATFSAPGEYVLTLTADDGELTGSDAVTITVEEEPPANTAPVVTASAPGSVTMPDAASLDGSVSDDGLPGPYSVAWSKASGPGTVTFGNANAEDTTATFSAAGTYVLTLTADDGELTGSDSVTITVEEEAPPPGPTPQTETHSDSLNKKFTSRTYQITAADGPAEATLTFDTKQRGKKNSNAVQLTLNVYDGGGNLVATASSDSGSLSMQLNLSAGDYTFEVTGGQTSFTLDLTYMAF